jgi:hypothetical protein
MSVDWNAIRVAAKEMDVDELQFNLEDHLGALAMLRVGRPERAEELRAGASIYASELKTRGPSKWTVL